MGKRSAGVAGRLSRAYSGSQKRKSPLLGGLWTDQINLRIKLLEQE